MFSPASEFHALGTFFGFFATIFSTMEHLEEEFCVFHRDCLRLCSLVLAQNVPVFQQVPTIVS